MFSHSLKNERKINIETTQVSTLEIISSYFSFLNPYMKI